VNIAINFRFPCEVGNFLPSWETTHLS